MWQLATQRGNSGIGDRGIHQFDLLQPLEAIEVGQPGVGNARFMQPKRF
jgi:hypothetical protein